MTNNRSIALWIVILLFGSAGLCSLWQLAENLKGLPLHLNNLIGFVELYIAYGLFRNDDKWRRIAIIYCAFYLAWIPILLWLPQSYAGPFTLNVNGRYFCDVPKHWAYAIVGLLWGLYLWQLLVLTQGNVKTKNEMTS